MTLLDPRQTKKHLGKRSEVIFSRFSKDSLHLTPGGPCNVGGGTMTWTWVKIKNPRYSQAVRRHEWFETRT